MASHPIKMSAKKKTSPNNCAINDHPTNFLAFGLNLEQTHPAVINPTTDETQLLIPPDIPEFDARRRKLNSKNFGKKVMNPTKPKRKVVPDNKFNMKILFVPNLFMTAFNSISHSEGVWGESSVCWIFLASVMTLTGRREGNSVKSGAMDMRMRPRTINPSHQAPIHRSSSSSNPRLEEVCSGSW